MAKKKSKGKLTLTIIIIIGIGAAYYFMYGLPFAILGPDSCEDTRTCCDDIAFNYLCWRNDPIDFSSFNAEDLRETKNDYTDKPPSIFMHPRNGWFFTSGNNLRWGNGIKGGMAEIESVNYGNVRGWNPNTGGNPRLLREYPHKYQVDFGGSGFNSEYEVVYVRDAVLMNMKINCWDNAGCQVPFEIEAYDKTISSWGRDQTSTPVTYGEYGGFSGFTSNIDYISTFGGWSGPHENNDFYFLVNVTPSSYLENDRKGVIYYALSSGEELSVSFLVTIGDYLSNADSYLNEYAHWENEAKRDFEEYVDGFSNLVGDDAQKKLYYRAIYGIYSNIMPAHGAISHSYCTPQIAGFRYNPGIVDGGQSRYDGLWIWDSSFCGLGLITGCEGGACRDDISAMQANWEESTFDDSTHHWCQEIHRDGTGILDAYCDRVNPPGLWSMVSYHKYLNDGNTGALCGIYDNLKGNHVAIKRERDADNDYLFHAGGGEMGRDGSDITSTGELPEFTGWYMLDSLFLKRIASVCEPSDVSIWRDEYDLVASAYENAYWDQGFQTYNHIDSGGNFESTSGVPHDNPLTLSFPAIFNTHSGTKDEIIMTRLLNGFTDVYFPTSIPTAHPCYTAQGTNNDCASGETWDGPIWPQDEFLVNEMYLEMIERGVPGAAEARDNFVAQTIQLYQTLPYPAESYNSNTGFSADWGSFPHSANSGFIIYLLTNSRLIDADAPNIDPPDECSEIWSCTDWDECIGGSQSRTCTDSNDCGTVVNMPVESQNCDTVCAEDWTCTDWSSCGGDNQEIRVCTDNNICGTFEFQPSESQDCSVQCSELWVCSDWSECVNNSQSRVCQDDNICGTYFDKPGEIQSCIETPVGDVSNNNLFICAGVGVLGFLAFLLKRRWW